MTAKFTRVKNVPLLRAIRDTYPTFHLKPFFSFSRMVQLKLSIVHDYEELQIGLVQEDDFYSSIDSITWVADTVFFRPAL